MRLMHVSLDEANNTPFDTVIRHLEYDSIEKQVKRTKEQEQQSNA